MFRRAGVIAASLAIPLAGVTVLVANPVGATHPDIPGIKCNVLVGTSPGTTRLKVCTGNTGTKGHSITLANGSSGFTETWHNGKTTTVSQSVSAGTGCPGTDLTEVFSGVVTADTTGSTSVGAAVSATICYDPSTTHVSLEPGTRFVFAP